MSTALLEEAPLFWVSRCHEEQEKSTTSTADRAVGSVGRQARTHKGTTEINLLTN